MRGGALLAVLLASAAAVLLPALPGGPVYDDGPAVLANPATRSPAACLKALGGLPPHRALTDASFLLLAGKAGNLLVHAAAAAAVLGIARSVGASAWAAFWFALHPLAVQTAAYLSQRAACLESALAFLSLLLFLRARPRFPWAALAVALLALGAKETAVTIPLLLAAAGWILRTPGETARSLLGRLWPFLLLPALGALKLLLAGTMRPVLLDVARGEVQLSPMTYLLQQPGTVLRYARLSALPFPLGFYHDRVFSVPLGASLAAAALLAGVLAWSLLGPERHRLPRLAAALFLLPLALECSVFPILDPAFNHRAYPGLLGGALLFAWAAARIPRGAGLAALLLMGAGSLSESRMWTSLDRLMHRDVRHAWHVEVVWANRAWQDLEAGRTQAAERLTRRALGTGLLNLKLASARALALEALGRRAEARELLDLLTASFPDHPKLLWQAVLSAEREGDAARLDALLERSEGMGAMAHGPLLLWAARRRTVQGRPDRAEALLDRHASFHAGSGEFWDHLGWVRFVQGKDGAAEAAYRRAISLKPDLPKAHFNLGSLLLKRGERAGAAESFRRALTFDPEYAKAREALSRLEASP